MLKNEFDRALQPVYDLIQGICKTIMRYFFKVRSAFSEHICFLVVPHPGHLQFQ